MFNIQKAPRKKNVLTHKHRERGMMERDVIQGEMRINKEDRER